MYIKTKKKDDRKICFYCFELSEPFRRIALDGYHIGKANLVDYARSLFFGNVRFKFKQCLKRGDRYFIVRKKNRVLSYGRICFKHTPEVELQANEASLISFLTIKEYRGQGMYTALIAEMMYYLKKKGYLRCIIWTFEDNHASRSVIQKLNFKPIAT